MRRLLERAATRGSDNGERRPARGVSTMGLGSSGRRCQREPSISCRRWVDVATSARWAKVSGRARLELRDGQATDRWLVVIDQGAVTVSRSGGAADCTIRAERDLFDRLCRGEANAMAAMLRGAVVVHR